MGYLIFILLFPFICFTQQTVNICGEAKTFKYSTQSNMGSDIEWYCNGQYYYGNDVFITWDKPGTYKITAQALINGCPSIPQTYTVNVIECDFLLYWVPNSFTPDQDEFNQKWGPIFADESSIDFFEIYVLNRWGEIIWKSLDPSDKWDGTYDGKKCPDGIYTWIMNFNISNINRRRIDHGYVMIIK